MYQSQKVFFTFFFLSSFLNLAQVDKDKLNNLFKDYSSPDSPGAVVTVVKEGKVIFNNAYGSANLEYNIPLTPQTPFNIASLTKQFLCFGILLLQDEGKLSIDDDVRIHIPELNKFEDTITLRNLMAHTSGLNDQWHLLSLAGWRLDDVITHDMVLDLIYKQQRLGFSPGEQYLYSNSAYTLLSEVIARVSGMSFPEFLKNRVFIPLGMHHSFVYDDYRSIVKNRAYSYEKNTEGYYKSVYATDTYGPAGIITSGLDIAKWMGNFHQITIGSKEMLELMDAPQTLNDGTLFGGALGQFINTHKNRKIIQHTGSEAAYRSYLVRFPEEQLAIAVFSNRKNSDTKKLALQTADLFLPPPKKEPNNNQTVSTALKGIKLNKKQLESFEGKYWNFQGNNSRKIELKQDTLYYVINDNRQIPMVLIIKNTFAMPSIPGNYKVQFEFDQGSHLMRIKPENGNVSLLKKYNSITYDKKQLKSFEGLYFSEELDTFLKLILLNDTLVVKQHRQEDTLLKPVMEDFFISDTWYMKSIRFIRDKNAVSGFEVSSNRMKNIRFLKVKDNIDK